MKRLCVILMTSAFLPWSLVSADIIHVPGDYPTIQQGIDACDPGDTVMVANGTYYENVTIQTGISLIGENRDNTIIDGSGTGDVILIEASYVVMRSFTITNGGSLFEDSGIKICNADNCAIERCKVYDNYAGLFLYSSSFNSIANCRFYSNYDAVLFFESYSGPYSDNQANQIQNNIFDDNAHCGILFEHTGDTHHLSNLIQGNRIINNDFGISMIMSEQNNISYNDLVANSDYAIALGMCIGGGEYNTFHHNNLISNHGGLVQATDGGGGVDYWYFDAENEGNHWSDYTGPDNNGDGIGDEPYYIHGDESQDLYPLMEPLYAIIQGGVSDGFEPIENVYVRVVGTEIDDYTGYDGIYSLEGLGAGNYDMWFSHPVYQDTTVLSVPSTPDHTTPLDVVMRIETDTDEENAPLPGNFALFQNYPNPFNASTVITFSLPESQNVILILYDLVGREVRILLDECREAGIHHIDFDASDLASGIYFYQLRAGESVESRRMVLLK